MRETTATPNINNINNMKGKDAEQCDRKTVDILTFVIHKSFSRRWGNTQL